jgi:hypothetical protein
VNLLIGGAQQSADDDALRLLLPSGPLPADPRQRLEQWLLHLPWSGPDLPEAVWQGYLRGEHGQALHSLLMLGIKAGEDGYKSDTGALLYERIGRKLERMFNEHGAPGLVPYSRQTMNLMLRGGFDAAAARQSMDLLAEAPNLAAAVMENMLGQWLRSDDLPGSLPEITAPGRSGKRKREEPDQRRVRPRTEGGGQTMPAPSRSGKRKLEEPDQRRVRARTEGGGQTMPVPSRTRPPRPGQ